MRLKNDTNNFAASFNITPPYQMMVIHSSKLIYPREVYQRRVHRSQVELIATDFNEYIANEPKVSFRNGRYYVVDGQHTIEGRILRNGGKDLPILCKVYTGLTMEQEALFFAEQNGHSAPLTAGIKLRAKVVGGDAPSKAFLAATNRVGLAFNYDSLQLSDYRISCVGTALKLYNQMGEKIYCESLRLIVAAWEGKPDSFRASVLRGVMHFVELYHGEFSEERLIRALGNVHPMEMGVLRCGDARSELMPELQIIPQEEFEAAQRIREDRSAHAAEEAEHHVPLRTRGQALLSNNVYCGHCGARLALTTSRKWRKLSDGTLDDTLRIRYTCYGKLRKQTDCTGQTGYTMHILDEIIDKMVRQIFSRLRGIPKEQLITSRYAKETAERKNHLQALQAERDKAEKDLLALKTEILAVIKGESAFPKDTLAEMIAAQEKKHTELDTLCEEASAELERNAELMANVSQLYEELISYADLYDSASFEAKKMIVSQLIRRVEVYRGYQIHVDFNFDLAQYLENSDELAC